MIKKYHKKPVTIEAIQWTGNNEEEIRSFCTTKIRCEKMQGYTVYGLDIETLEGTMHASIGDYIIKGVTGEFYPCKPDIF